MYLLNYLYFLIITLIGLKFLTMKRGVMVSPLNKSQKMALDGPEMFWILTFSTGILAFSAPGVLDLMAIRLLVLEIFCFVGLFICKRSPQWSAMAIFYFLYIVWLVIGLSYTPAPGYGIRVILKYLYPLFIVLFASAAVRDKEVFLKASLGARTIALISIGVAFIPYVGMLFPGVFWTGTAKAINYISMCIFSLALFYYTQEKRKNLLLSILFMLPCFLWVFRTSIMGTTMALMMFFFFKYRLKSVPVIFGIAVIAVVAVFTIPNLREKMFKDSDSVSIEQFQRGEISKDDINSNARFSMWEQLEARFYKGNELMGSGTGSVQNYMYSNFVFGGLKVPHNDYVQMLCDSGVIGLALYLLIIITTISHCFIVYHRYSDIAIKVCAIVAGSSLTGVAFSMYSDNVVNYSMATLSYPFGFYGMMLGLIKGKNR
ncbi:MAG TPA: O-antigen ligase family protein [Candidatus Barnesiella excrementavium]|nr:O-antigen ligase family protein [Candidatus Barnesiella excrementavium]